MTYRVFSRPLSDSSLYASTAIQPLARAAAAVDPRTEFRRTEAGLHIVLSEIWRSSLRSAVSGLQL